MLRVLYLTTLISTIHPLKYCIYFCYRKNCNHPFFEVTVPFLHVVPLFVTHCHSLSFAVSRCHSLSLAVTRCITRFHSLSLTVICCHSLSFVVTRCTIRCHSLSLVVPLVVNRCHFMYHSSVFL